MADRARAITIIAVALLIVFTAAALAPVRSYDFFWHLATGRWIVEHRALPAVDPFALASDRVPWINGEWLFEVLLYGAGSIQLISWLRALVVAATFAAIFAVTARHGIGLALLVTAVCFAGGVGRLDSRPSTAAAVFIAIAVALLGTLESRRSQVLYVILTIVWMNMHPSALLSPLLAAACAFLSVKRSRATLIVAGTSALALLVNPYGLHGVIAPLKLTMFARSGQFANAEWLASPPAAFPLLYVCVAGCVFAFLFTRDKRDGAWRFGVFALLAYLAIAHVRNQGLFFAAFPLLIAPLVDRDLPQRLLAIGGAAAIVLALANGDFRGGVDDARFPVHAVERLKQTALRGNIYNPDQFGGYLIWSFYPERRALTDGRNELYHRYIPEYALARSDSRAWSALLQKYRIDLAVDEYRAPLDVINPRTGAHQAVPASLAYWPRREWALIAFDSAGMVFARRAAFPQAQLERWELKGIVPDAR